MPAEETAQGTFLYETARAWGEKELGLFGAILVLMLFGYLLYRLYYIARHAADTCGMLVVSGIFIHIALQVILNICVNLNLIPTTGVTLPFVSYGGTSVIFTML